MNNLKGELLCLKASNIKPNFSELSRIYHKDRRVIKKLYYDINSTKERKVKPSKLDKYRDLIKEKLNIPGSNMKAVYMFIKTNVDDENMLINI